MKRFLAMSVLLLVLLSSSFVLANYDFCSVAVGRSSTCYNTMSVTDELANFSHKMYDHFSAPDPYHIRFSYTEFLPDVVRGDPIYQNYWIMDNLNSEQILLVSSYYGKHLADYSLIAFETAVTAGYYPKPYGSPTTTLAIRNAPPFACLPPNTIYCATYYQASQFSVQ